ncbi:MAG: hypothetical protein RL514_2660 [Verrucomicrobiota bacterium]
MPGNPQAPVGHDLRKHSHQHGNYQKVLDARKRPVRGLWVRNGRYYARVTLPHPGTDATQVRRVPLEAATTVAEAQAALRRLLTQREDQTLPVLRQTPKFRDYVADYFAHYAKASKEKRTSTLATERAHLNAWMEHLGGTRLHRITPKMVDKFLAHRQSEGVSPRTVNLAVTCLRNVLDRARQEKLIKSLPTENRRPLKYKPRERPGFNDAEVESICMAGFRPVFAGGKLAKPGEPGVPLKNAQQFADFVRLLAGCGSRMSETLRLKWSDVHWDLGQLHVGTDGLSKNGKARVVDFNPRLKEHLQDMHRRRVPDSGWLFPSPQRGERDERAKTFRESLLLARAAAGLPEFGFHDCRHFFISRCVMSGIDFMTIARWVGHLDGGILIGKVYGHLNNEHTKKQAQRIEFK